MTVNLGHLSETERARCLLEESEARYRALVEHLPVVTYTATLDEPSSVLYVSPRIEVLLGYTPDEYRRNKGIWPDRIHEDDRARVVAKLHACRTAALPLATEYRFLRRDGRTVWVRDEATVVRDTAGQPLCIQGVMQDITDRKRAERQLAEAQALTHVGSWEWDLIADRITWSDEHYRIFGLEPRAGGIGYRDVLNYIHAADRPIVERVVAQSLSDGQPYTVVFRVRHPDGAERLVEAHATIEVDGTGRPIRKYGTAQDITDRRRADEAVHRSQREFRDIIQLAPIGIYRSTPAGRFLMANPTLARMLGYGSPEELLTLDIARDVYMRAADRAPLVHRSEQSNASWTGEIEWKKQDGTAIWVLVSAGAVRDDAGRVRYFEAFVQDITDRRRAADELARSRRRLRDLARREHDVREQERKLVAREIHDELGQALTALRLDLSWLMRRLPAKPAGLVAKAQAMVGVVDQTIDAVRRIATQLRPPILDDLGLVAAIEWQAGEMAARTGIQCALDLPAEVRLDEARATSVFRIFQEALTNVVRHAGASSVRVVLRATSDQLVLEIKDDGRGIAPAEQSDQRALGLLGMRERAQAAGGALEVLGSPGKGTTVALRMRLAAYPIELDAP